MGPTGTLATNRPIAGSGIKGNPPDTIWPVLFRAWEHPFSVSSNFARENALAVATAASLGWISNIRPDGLELSRKYHLTLAGAAVLQSKEKLSK